MKIWNKPLSKIQLKGLIGKPGRRGITLIELMVTISIFGVILGVVFAFMAQTSRSYSDSRDRVQYQQGLRAVLSLMTREIRSAGCDPDGVGFEKFLTADVGLINCQMDLNGDADTDDNTPDENITYSYNAADGEISRDDGTGAQVILRDLDTVIFTYFDQDGLLLGGTPLNATDRAEIAFVEIGLGGETDSGEPVQYTTRVNVRNF